MELRSNMPSSLRNDRPLSLEGSSLRVRQLSIDNAAMHLEQATYDVPERTPIMVPECLNDSEKVGFWEAC
jgi:hypothetical protein